MANSLGYFNPEYYANMLLVELEEALGIANRVERGYEVERNTLGNEQGDTIKIKGTADFVVQNAPGPAQDLVTKQTDLVVDKWREVRYTISDKEIAYTGEEIINLHIRPMAFRLAKYVDADLQSVLLEVPHYTVAGSDWKDNIVDAHKVLFDNAVPMNDVANLHFQMDGTAQAGALKNSAFSQDQGAGGIGVNTQLSGNLGFRYGMNTYANQVFQSYTKGNGTGYALNADAAKGATEVVLKTGTNGFLVGDSITIGAVSSDKPYAVTETNVAAGTITVKISPPLRVAKSVDDDVAYTATPTLADASVINAAYHSSFATLAFARLPENNPGVETVVAQDPKTGIAVRVQVGYDISTSAKVAVADILYGHKMLNADMAVRVHQA